jgi:uncharacterized protein (DUF433 family)
MSDSYSEQLAAEIDRENTYRSRIGLGDTAELREAQEIIESVYQDLGSPDYDGGISMATYARIERWRAALAAQPSRGVSGHSSWPQQPSAGASFTGCPRCDCIDQIDGQCMQCGLKVARYEVFKQEMQAMEWAAERETLAAEITDQIQALPTLDESEFYDSVHKIIVEILADIPRPNGAVAKGQQSSTLVEKKAVQPAGEREPDKVEYIEGIGCGRPTIRGIRVEVICQRYLAGETIAELSYDYGLLPAETEEAIRHQIKVWRKKAPATLAAPTSTGKGERE